MAKPRGGRRIARSLTPEEEAQKLQRDAIRDVESAYINVRIALRDDCLPRPARAVLLTARDQLAWTSKLLAELA